MNVDPSGKFCTDQPSSFLPQTSTLDRRLARYLATCSATAAGTLGLALTSEAAVVGNATVQPFGIDQDVNIDFNNDGEIDFQIDHDRDSSGNDFLQIDKNDQTGLALPGVGFPDAGLPGQNDDHGYLTDAQGNYPLALSHGTSIGPASPGLFEFQESDNYLLSGQTRRANRLVDEDLGLADGALASPPPGTAHWPGLNGDIGYLGLKIDFNNSGSTHYGWVGVRITNADDATGEVVGYAYETTPGKAILAGHVPEPSTMVAAAIGACALFGGRFFGRRRNRRES